MFGIGPQEVVVIVLLLLIVFGSEKLVSIAKDTGRLVNEARAPSEEFKKELASLGKEEHQDDRRRKEDQVSERGEGKESPQKEEAHPVAEVSAQTEQQR